MPRQSDVIKHMKDKEVLFHLYLTQVILLILALLLGWFLYNDMESFISIWKWDLEQILLYGVGSAIIVILLDLFLMKVLPEEMYNDGGINDKVFQNRPLWHIFILTAFVSFSEELLFRGVIQTNFGIILASIIFAVLHVRYLYKWVLFIVVVSLSFFLGWIYLKTNNLWVTVIAHFLIDFVFALIIRMKHLKEQKSIFINS